MSNSVLRERDLFLIRVVSCCYRRRSDTNIWHDRPRMQRHRKTIRGTRNQTHTTGRELHCLHVLYIYIISIQNAHKKSISGDFITDIIYFSILKWLFTCETANFTCDIFKKGCAYTPSTDDSGSGVPRPIKMYLPDQ